MSGVNTNTGGTIQVQPLLTVKDLAGLLRMHERSIWRLVARAEAGDGDFPKPIRIGKRAARWRWRDVEKYLDKLAGNKGQN